MNLLRRHEINYSSRNGRNLDVGKEERYASVKGEIFLKRTVNELGPVRTYLVEPEKEKILNGHYQLSWSRF